MILESLRLDNLRNHRHSELACPPGLIVFRGENGAGKTSILEAVSLLCSTRSFVTSQERSIVRRDAESFSIEGEFVSDAGSRHVVACSYPLGGRKEITIDHAPPDRNADVIGRFPVVILAPQHRMVTAGGPGERRAFVDFAISQIHARFLADLLEYRRIVRQRNALLSSSDLPARKVREQLDAWDEAWASCAARIISMRLFFLERFKSYVHDALFSISGEKEVPSIEYRCTIAADGAPSEEACLSALHARRESDLRMRTTTAGPHRDDVLMTFNGMDVRAHASQGQHKSLLIALKLAEFHYLAGRLEEQPLLLLDDVFSELDDERLGRIAPLLQTSGQTFITTASNLTHLLPQQAECITYLIEQGRVSTQRKVA